MNNQIFKIKEEIRSILLEFLTSYTYKRNYWIEVPGMKVYVRKSWRPFTFYPIQLMKNYSTGRYKPNCFDIASIIIEKELRGNGLFSWFFELVEEVSPYRFILIESILNPLVLSYAEKYGYTNASSFSSVLGDSWYLDIIAKKQQQGQGERYENQTN